MTHTQTKQPTLAWLGFAVAMIVLVVWLISAASEALRAPSHPPSTHPTGSVSSILAEHFEPVTHPPPAFPYQPSESSVNERPILEFLALAPVEAQVRMDVALHDLAINADSFGERGSAFLRKNSELKLRVLDLLKQPEIDPAQLAEATAGLRSCEDIHRHYLAMNPSIKTGSHAWHRAWMSAYEEWIQALSSKPAALTTGKP